MLVTHQVCVAKYVVQNLMLDVGRHRKGIGSCIRRGPASMEHEKKIEGRLRLIARPKILSEKKR